MTRWMEEWLPALAHFTFQWNHNVLLSNWNSTWHTKCISVWLLQFFLNHFQYDFFILSQKGIYDIIRGYVFYYKCLGFFSYFCSRYCLHFNFFTCLLQKLEIFKFTVLLLLAILSGKCWILINLNKIFSSLWIIWY